jgi:3D (Asp-Asp-Asp) domain-containing protein
MNLTKNPLFKSIVGGVILGLCVFCAIVPQISNARFDSTTSAAYVAKATSQAVKAIKTIEVIATAYSSTPDQTDDTPLITASGKSVRDGIIANNLLPFGTKVRIPKIYGDKVFVVEDRMHTRKGKYMVDIWMPSRELAVNFGAKTTEIEVLEN